MFAVIFEVQPRRERFDDYLGLAKQLKPKLEAIDGFIDNERFASRRTEGRLLSLSIWRDEKSVVRWRTNGEHHGVQEKGRLEIFEDYHLRVGEITADTAPPSGLHAEETRRDETATGVGKSCTITELSPSDGQGLAVEPEALAGYLGLHPGADGLLEQEVFESITAPGKLLLLASWRDVAGATTWRPAAVSGVVRQRHRLVRVIRDYGLSDRREAPQYFPHVHKGG